jgi:membrane glycosyltransferase
MDGVSDLAVRQRYAPPAPRRALATLPLPSPLPMPIQPLDRARGDDANGRTAQHLPSSPPAVGWRRFLVLGGAAAITIAATVEMSKVLAGPGSRAGTSVPEVIMLALFVLLFAWIALAFVNAVVGFAVLLRGRAHPLLAEAGATLTTRTALLMPIHNEQANVVFGAIAAMHASLVEAGVGDRFDIFVLSDTTDPDAWIAEEAGLLAVRQHVTGGPAIHYRRRADNAGRKVGNISEWITRFGGAYAQFVVLDADSVMDGAALARLAGAMERHPDIGLIQTLPISVGGQTLFARMQQFAGRIHGVLVAAGSAWWQGAEGNYYGHNAIIRTAAFAAAAGLPRLPGGLPFGGEILSHDFIEAALLRRAGWGVHTVPLLTGSHEQGPPTLIDSAIRDRRWCQGNLQHTAILPAAGLHPISRLHLLTGIGAYLTAPLWLAFLVGGIVLSVQAHLAGHAYFPAGQTLFPHWPIVDPVRAKWMFVATMLMLVVPKLLAAAAFLRDRRDRHHAGGTARVIAGTVIEFILSGLLAPVMMLTHAGHVAGILAGRDAGWSAQRRDGRRVAWREAARHAAWHTLLGIALGSVVLIAPALALWMLPVILGLLLAVPLVVLTGSAAAGQVLARAGLLMTPEEASPPRVLSRAAACRAWLPDGGPRDVGDGISRLVADEALLALHLALLPPARGAGVARATRSCKALRRATGMAKVAAVGTLADALPVLDREEKLALLGCAATLTALVALGREAGRGQRRQAPAARARGVAADTAMMAQ